jgi:hypothetical protein
MHCVGCAGPLPETWFDRLCQGCLERAHSRLAEALLSAFTYPFAAPVSWQVVLHALARAGRRRDISTYAEKGATR